MRLEFEGSGGGGKAGATEAGGRTTQTHEDEAYRSLLTPAIISSKRRIRSDQRAIVVEYLEKWSDAGWRSQPVC